MVLMIGSFILVEYMVYIRLEKHDNAVVSMYGDLILYESEQDGVPIDPEHTEIAEFYGNYVCKWHGADYVYIYQPDVEKNTITYICVSKSDSIEEEKNNYPIAGQVIKGTLTKEELEVWNGETVFGHHVFNNDYGHEIGTIFKIKDSFGNEYLTGMDTPYEDIYKQIISFFSLTAINTAVVILIVYFWVLYIIRKKVSVPVQKISQTMSAFITDGKRTDVKLDESGNDEFAMMSVAFNRMTDDIDLYLKNIKEFTTDKERQEAELDIARRIQEGFLQKTHLVTDKFNISAAMHPARTVGGDLYDYIELDDNHSMMVIADVSGKGISAAMFMAVTLVLIRQYALQKLPPDEIFRQVNHVLAAQNSELLFATSFIAIYNSDTKTLTYSNAGHNLPYIVNETVMKLECEAGTPLGLFDNEEYVSKSVQLKTGDIIFFYTDGVTEAINSDKKFFGVERLEAELKNFRVSHAEDIIAYINNTINEFKDGAEQYDDTTMLALTLKETTELQLDYDGAEFEKIKKFILSLPLSRADKLSFCLAAEEYFINVCSYAFEGGAPEGEKITCKIAISDRISLVFEDGGKPFNPLEDIASPEDYDIDTQIGGLGRFIAFSIADEVKYSYENNKNILTLVKYF